VSLCMVCELFRVGFWVFVESALASELVDTSLVVSRRSWSPGRRPHIGIIHTFNLQVNWIREIRDCCYLFPELGLYSLLILLLKDTRDLYTRASVLVWGRGVNLKINWIRQIRECCYLFPETPVYCLYQGAGGEALQLRTVWQLRPKVWDWW